MARFFLHLKTPDGSVPDEEGIELAHLGNLRRNATKIAERLVADDPVAVDYTFEVVDEDGRTVLSTRVGDLLPSKDSIP